MLQAANTEQASTFARPKPPGTLFNQRLREEYKSEPARDLPMAAPIKINNGMVSRVKLSNSLYIVSATMATLLAGIKMNMKINATLPTANAMGMPLNKNRKVVAA
jgi:hypothetical protein